MADSFPILELFARLADETREFVEFDGNIEDYAYDDKLVAHRSKRSFPDMILRYGAMVEVKDSKSSTVTSFNSTYPSGRKSVLDIEKTTGQKKRSIRESLKEAEDEPEFSEKRDVYYLVRTNREDNPTVSFVHGGYFGDSESSAIAETLGDVLKEIRPDVDEDRYDDLLEIIDEEEHVRNHFSRTRKTSTGVKIRYRIMYEVDNDLNPNEHPEVPEGALSLLVPADRFASPDALDSAIDADVETKRTEHGKPDREDEYYVAVSRP
ncbi:MAG: hypothetical protein U5J64_01415 [Halobacteriales archaeon]|nr:hypothetical protein [Halobacteriales archaeon]